MKRWRIGDVLGALLFALLLGVRVRQGVEGSALAWVLAVQAGLTVVLLLARREERTGSAPEQKLTAWAAVLLPFGLRVEGWGGIGFWLALLGVVFSLWGLVSLGRSFGIAPADRGLVTRGAYRLVRHPMYLGELVSYLAAVLAHPALWNAAVMTAIVVVFILRIRWEEGLIEGYETYRQRVRWRLLPGLW